MSYSRTPEALVRKAGTRNPFAIADELKIRAFHVEHPESGLPGLTCLVANRPSIFINDSYFYKLRKNDPYYTDEIMQDDINQVAAHELGHAVLHRKVLRKAPIREYEIFNVRSTMEVEANNFAARLLIDPNEMTELFNSDLTILQVARAIHVNINLIIYMLDEYRSKGGNLPYIPKTCFMRNIHGLSDWQ